MTVLITLRYDPDEPDPDDATGMSEANHDLLVRLFSEHGLEIEGIEKMPEPPAYEPGPPKARKT